MSVHVVQRNISVRKIKKGGIIFKLQKQSNSRVFDFIVMSVMDYMHITTIICLFGVLHRKINESPCSKEVQTGWYSNYRRVSQIGKSVMDFCSRLTVTLIMINKYSLEKWIQKIVHGGLPVWL